MQSKLLSLSQSPKVTTRGRRGNAPRHKRRLTRGCIGRCAPPHLLHTPSQHRYRCHVVGTHLLLYNHIGRYTLHPARQALILEELQLRGVLNVVQLLGYDCRAIQLHMQLYLPLLRPLAKYLQHAFRRASAGHKNALLHTVIYGVLEGVAKLHEHDVCHRDLKIDNVLVAGPLPPDAGQRTARSWEPSMMSAQLCDFGYSLMAGVNEGVDEARRLNPGTPPYIAPEVYDARQAAKADDACRLDRQGWQRADVYSTAMMLWGL